MVANGRIDASTYTSVFRGGLYAGVGWWFSGAIVLIKLFNESFEEHTHKTYGSVDCY